MTEKSYNDELYHYGVLGMKWGVKRGKTAQAYTKASNKAKKLDEKIAKFDKRAEKTNYKYNKVLARGHTSKKLHSRQRRHQAALNKQIYKAEKWYKSMEKTFTKKKLSKEQINAGKKYAEMIAKSRNMDYYFR